MAYITVQDLTNVLKQHKQRSDQAYVHQEVGKGLSSNDFTDEYKETLDDIIENPITDQQIENSVNTVYNSQMEENEQDELGKQK